MAAAIELVKILSRKRKAEQEFVSNQFTLMEENIKRRYLRQVEFETEVAMGTPLSTITLKLTNVGSYILKYISIYIYELIYNNI